MQTADTLKPGLSRVTVRIQERIRNTPRNTTPIAKTPSISSLAATLCPPSPDRVRVAGKFIFRGEDKLFIRGVTYGTFKPDADGNEFPAREVVQRDFEMMQRSGINAIRTYTAPPLWLLDEAERHRLLVMIGLPVERSVAFVDYREIARSVERMVQAEIHKRQGHPAVLGYTIGNEIPASIVRWHGSRRIEHFLRRLYNKGKEEDPRALITYVNYPSTEYLRLPFLDFVSFNVYLEQRDRFEAYIARLHNIAGNRPLVMAEIGLDSLRNGEAKQAETLGWQVRTSFTGGCAGTFVYAWTDEWFRGGAEVEDWKFGIVDRDRQPKPALKSVARAFEDFPFPDQEVWPRISVAVCSHNGGHTIRECLEGLTRLEYPDFEVILVDDGSTDDTATIAREFPIKLIQTEQRGLSNARNIAFRAATGEIVAYIDDDAFPDPHWLHYLALTFRHSQHAAVGGPNIPPRSDGNIAYCVAHAPGGPTHVLLSDRVAEHIPGVNMAFRKNSLEALGGFDEQFWTAGDDVDMCWRLQQKGWTIGFSPAAVVWHHRRNSVRTFWRQQRGYGKAEALLVKKWPDKYNDAGLPRWAGRVYGIPHVRWRAGRVFHGTWGLAPFQALYEPNPGLIDSLPVIPEWYLLVGTFAALSFLGYFWRPLEFFSVFFALAVGATLVRAARCASSISFTGEDHAQRGTLKLRLLTTFLHLIQPLARLNGRLRQGLTLWRKRVSAGLAWPRPWVADIWTKNTYEVEHRLRSIEQTLRTFGAVPRRGGDFDHWDLEVSGNSLGAMRLFMAVEHHGSGKQLLRVRTWPRCSPGVLAFILILSGLSVQAAVDASWVACTTLGGFALVLLWLTFRACADASAAFLQAIRKIEHEERCDDRA